MYPGVDPSVDSSATARMRQDSGPIGQGIEIPGEPGTGLEIASLIPPELSAKIDVWSQRRKGMHRCTELGLGLNRERAVQYLEPLLHAD